MRLLVTGDRFWNSYHIIAGAINLAQPDVVIQGGAPGADHQAMKAAQYFQMGSVTRPAWWKCLDYEMEKGQTCRLPDGRHHATHGKAAGVLRNQRMLDEEAPDLVYAFHDDLETSRGTRDCVRRAMKMGLKVVHFTQENPDGRDVVML